VKKELSGSPTYTQESGAQPPGKFLVKAAIEKELKEKGVEKDSRVMLVDGSGPWFIYKREGGRLHIRNELNPALKKEIGLGAIDIVL